jgi:release factor glutamine methyltransferase
MSRNRRFAYFGGYSAHVIAQAPPFLNSGGWLLLEHGFDQAVALRDVLAQRFKQVQSQRFGGD